MPRLLKGTIVTAFLLTSWVSPLTQAATSVGLVKGSTPAVYYVAEDGKRYTFRTSNVYFTWYTDFSNIRRLTDSELTVIPLGGNVTYRPGVRLLKIDTIPKVYAVAPGRVLRWIQTESTAAALYGSQWYTRVDSVSDLAFADYTEGAPITEVSDYEVGTATFLSPTISGERGLVAPPAVPHPDPAPAPQPVVQEFVVEADDAGFYPSSIAVEKGKPVKVTFKVRSVGVYFAGLDFRSSLFTTKQAGLGQLVTVEFTAPQTATTFSSYWPSSGVLKATGTITIQ